MITLTEKAKSVLADGNQVRYLRIESWLAGVLLHDDVPVRSANEETDRSLTVPERVTLTVPREADAFSWAPVYDTHPLAANGQRLRVLLGVGLEGDRVEWFQRGTFLIDEATPEGDEVEVTALGLLRLPQEARLLSPYQPSGTLVSTLRGLVEPALTVMISSSLVDRSVPSGLNFDDDRLGWVEGLLDAWPAEAYVTPSGFLMVRPAASPVASDSVLSLTDQAGGTVIQAVGSSTREGAYTAVVAKGTASDGGQVLGVAYDTSSGAHRANGPFNPLPVPYEFASPLLTTVDQCNAAAATVMARIRRETAQEYEVTMVPHPALQAGDVVKLTTAAFTDLPCTIEYLSLPYLAAGGSQTLRVRSLTS